MSGGGPPSKGSLLQCDVVCVAACSVLQCDVSVCCGAVWYMQQDLVARAVCCGVLQRIVVCCSVLQCVAECCSVL